MISKHMTDVISKIPHEYIEMFKKNNNSGNYLTIGAVQLGKSSYILYKALYLIANKIDVIIVTNCSLKYQFYERFKVLGINNKLIQVVWNNRSIYKIISKNKSPTIYVIGSHYINIKKFNNEYNKIKSNRPGKYFVMIDEGDLYNEFSSSTKDKINKITTEISLLKGSPLCSASEIITATPYSYTYVKDKFPIIAKNVSWIPPSDDYVSYNHHLFQITEVEDLYKMDNKEQIKEELNLIIEDARKQLTNDYVRMYVNITENVHKGIIHQDMICDIIREINRNCSIITANDSKYFYYGSGKKTEYNSISECFNCHANSTLNSTTVTVDTKKELFIVSCKQTGRGHSLRNVAKLSYSTKNIIYANSAVFCCSEGSSTDSIIQQALRIGGRFPDYDKDFKLLLYTTEHVITTLDEQFKQDIINYNNFKNNPDKLLTELVEPTNEKLNKVVSNTRGKHFQKKINNKYYQTSDTYDVAKSSLKVNINAIEGPVCQNILRILKFPENIDGITAEDIYISDDTWAMTTKTPVDSIRSRCLTLYKAGLINRTDRVPYKYLIRT